METHNKRNKNDDNNIVYMTTFVTCLIDIYDGPVNNKTLETRVCEFEYIASTCSQICVYVCDKSEPFLKERFENLETIRLINIGNIKESFAIYNTCYSQKDDIELPVNRNPKKDTFEYITLMHSKLDFLHHAISENPFGSELFAWVDFNLTHIVNHVLEKQYIHKYLKQVAVIQPNKIERVIIPGCWSKMNSVDYILDNIHWRFCGGFFIGKKENVLEFYEIHLKILKEFLRTYKKLPWEVNLWAYLEYACGWTPEWFSGDHNCRMVELSPRICSIGLAPYASIRKHSFPNIPGFSPSSTSYINYNGSQVLNIRYVNYKLTSQGYYIIHHPENHIHSKNMMTILEEATSSPKYFYEMELAEPDSLVCHGGSIYGLEDIRLFNENGSLKFIATNLNYSPTKRNNMIIGEYNTRTHQYENPQIIYSYDRANSTCEKNWVPLPYSEKNKAQYFIFKWCPIEICEIENDQLKIVRTIQNREPFFNRVRGSTIFQELSDSSEYMGVVHFSEEGSPRNYYHMLVVLDESYTPIRYSPCFYFHNMTVEFCIGFHIKNGEYHFWISNFDKDPEEFIVHSSMFSTWFDFSL